MGRGPMELTVVEFPGAVPGAKLAPELRRLVEADVIRIVDVAFVSKDPDGTVELFELADREGHPDYEALDEVLASLDGLISDEDLDDIAEDVNAGATAMILLFEHTWAARLREIVGEAGGGVTYTERISSAVVNALTSVN